MNSKHWPPRIGDAYNIAYDPSSVGLDANVGQRAINTSTGDAYTKTGSGLTDWSKGANGSGGIIRGLPKDANTALLYDANSDTPLVDLSDNAGGAITLSSSGLIAQVTSNLKAYTSQGASYTHNAGVVSAWQSAASGATTFEVIAMHKDPSLLVSSAIGYIAIGKASDTSEAANHQLRMASTLGYWEQSSPGVGVESVLDYSLNERIGGNPVHLAMVRRIDTNPAYGYVELYCNGVLVGTGTSQLLPSGGSTTIFYMETQYTHIISAKISGVADSAATIAAKYAALQ